MKTIPIHNHQTYESFWHAGVRYYRCTGCRAVRRAIKVEDWPEEAE